MELADNFIQFLVTLLGVCISGLFYYRSRKQAYFLLTCFYGCFALSSLYWTLYLFLFSETPQVFYVSDVGWIASVIFLHILQYALATGQERSFRCRVEWLSVVIGLPLCVLYCTYGDILSNLIWCGMMVVLSFCSIRGVVYARRQTGGARRLQVFHIAILCYTAVEYCLWTSGCIWRGDTFLNPYYWFDILLTGTIIGLLPATRKAVGG